jgi:hypothetical protein
MNIDDLTIKPARELANPVSNAATPVDNSAWEIGSIYLLRSANMLNTGRLIGITKHELILEDAAWIPVTGRFSEAVAKAECNEVVPFPDSRVIIGRGCVIDAVKVKLAPRSKK